MPMGFEFPHLIHPATMDSMFQCLFVIECKAAVPAFIDRLVVAAQIPRSCGHHFHGFATASRVDLRDVVANISMANDAEFESAAVVIEGLHLTDISPWGGPVTFLPNHRNLCAQIQWKETTSLTKEKSMAKLIGLAAHRHPRLNILQVGGNGVTSGYILDILSGLIREMRLSAPLVSRYTLAGQGSEHVLDEVRELCNGQFAHIMECRDIDAAASSRHPKYDLILAVTGEVGVDRLLSFLKPAGILAFGAYNTAHSHTAIEARTMVDGITIFRHHAVMPLGMVVDLIVPPLEEAIALAAALYQVFGTVKDGVQLNICSAAEASTMTGDRPCICVCEFAAPMVAEWDESAYQIFHRLQQLRRRILWLTRGAHMDVTHPQGAAILGLARTIMSEDSLKKIVTLDIGRKTAINEELAWIVYKVFAENLFGQAVSGQPLDTEYVERKGRVYVPRLTPLCELNHLIEDGTTPVRGGEQIAFLKDQHILAMDIKRPGLGGDWFAFATLPDLSPVLECGEYEVEFRGSILQASDLATAMGKASRQSISADMFGVVTRRWDDSARFEVGEEVAVFCPSGRSFTNRLRAASGLIKRQIQHDDCPGTGLLIPSLHIAAYYGLAYVGEIGHIKDAVVMVLSGASAQGQAAVQVARMIGAKIIIATTVGDDNGEQRRDLVHRHRLDGSHVIGSTDPDFIAHVLGLTENKGVHVVFDASYGESDVPPRMVRRGKPRHGSVRSDKKKTDRR
jgi:hypothetical protein